MLTPLMKIARDIRRIRCDRRISQRALAISVGCSQPYLVQIETGKRPVSQRIAQKLEVALGVSKGRFTKAVFVRGRPPLTQESRRILAQLRGAQGLPSSKHDYKNAPEFPRSSQKWKPENPFWPMALHLGEAAGLEVRQLEQQRRADERYWRLLNSILFESWSEKRFLVLVALLAGQMTGLRFVEVGGSLQLVDGVSGQEQPQRCHPAFLLRRGKAAIAWFPQCCVRTRWGYRWPDHVLVIARGGRRITAVVEVDGARYHDDAKVRDARDRELGVPVFHLAANRVGEQSLLERVLEWAESLLAE